MATGIQLQGGAGAKVWAAAVPQEGIYGIIGGVQERELIREYERIRDDFNKTNLPEPETATERQRDTVTGTDRTG